MIHLVYGRTERDALSAYNQSVADKEVEFSSTIHWQV